MNTLIIILLLISLTIFPPVSLAKPSHLHDHSGFTVDLIHRDSPLSPLYNPTDSPTDRLQNAFRRPMKSEGFGSKVSTDLIGDYMMKFQIGTPPTQVFVGVNLVSNIAWTQCKSQGGGFVPASSSTYRVQSSQSKACKAYPDNFPCEKHNVTNNVCCSVLFEVNNEIESVIGRDTFWFGETPIRNVLFGCVDDYKAANNLSGVVGLCDDPYWSFIGQLKPVIHGRFSYCLTSNDDSKKNRTSKLYFGERAAVSGPNVVSISLLKNESFGDYNVFLMNVVVGNSSSSSTYDEQPFDYDDDLEVGNMHMDFSSIETIIPYNIYDLFSSSLTKAIGGEVVHVHDHPRWANSICYKDLNLDRVPVVTFRFSGGDVKVPPENIFLEVERGLSCLTIRSTLMGYNYGWVGNLFQRNFMVGYDLVKRKVYFKPTDCTMQD